jgi:ribosomal protein RSM22 (predicted rRNA methylase)
MELPNELKYIIENELENINIKVLQKNAENISLKYRDEIQKKGKRLVTEDVEAITYSAVRMPATYSAVYTALKYSLEICNENIDSLLDVGAGTGAGSWAANELLNLEQITCLEREDAMLNFGSKIMKKSENDVIKNAKWEKFDLVNSEIKYNADLVICSYVLNELNETDRINALQKLWNATNKILLIIEPGTPMGFSEIKENMKILKSYGASVIAPCPNIENCSMPEDDWCHTTCRVSRTKIHKLLKNADVPYEDEKFSYVSVSKTNVNKPDYARVLRHPKIESGKITLQICTKSGISEKIVTKKEKELFKISRKLKCGDKF